MDPQNTHDSNANAHDGPAHAEHIPFSGAQMCARQWLGVLPIRDQATIFLEKCNKWQSLRLSHRRKPVEVPHCGEAIGRHTSLFIALSMLCC